MPGYDMNNGARQRAEKFLRMGEEMVLSASLAILACAVIACVKPIAAFSRIYFAFAALGWGAFLLIFYMDALIRVAARKTGLQKSTDAFNAGILAYNEALWECRISLGMLLLALAILVFFPTHGKAR
jgi:hypothetical protein